MSEQPDDQVPQPANNIRETSIAQAMTSTGIHKHHTAFINTGLPILQVALNVEMMTAKMADLLQPLAREGATPAIAYAKLRRNLRAAAESVGQEPPQITTIQRVGFRLDAYVAFAPGASTVQR